MEAFAQDSVDMKYLPGMTDLDADPIVAADAAGPVAGMDPADFAISVRAIAEIGDPQRQRRRAARRSSA